MSQYDLDRFVKAQKDYFEIALKEIQGGKKLSHWIWFIFPQIKGLGYSEKAQYYSIQDIEETKEYLSNEYLYNNLIKICKELLKLESKNILDIMGYPDNLKLCSSMTLFNMADPKEEIFKDVLEKYFNGNKDKKTLDILNNILK